MNFLRNLFGKTKSIPPTKEATSTPKPMKANDATSKFEEIRQLVSKGSPSAARQSGKAWPLIHFLYDKLATGSVDERKEAAHYLCYLPPVGHKDSIAKLMLALEKEDNLDVIEKIIWALRGLEAKTAIPKLQAMLNENKYNAIRERIEKGINYLLGN